MKAIAALALLAGCWRGDVTPPAEPVAKPAPVSHELCAEFGFKFLMRGAIRINGASGAPAFDDADADAERDVEQAMGAADTDMHRAATLFLSCAERYRAVPDDDPLRQTAAYNAVACYENAMYSYAMAGKLATEGRAALQRAAREDLRMAPELHRILGSLPTDCAVRR